MVSTLTETETGPVLPRTRTPLNIGRSHLRGMASPSREPLPSPRANADFQRAASYTYLPDAKHQRYGSPKYVMIKDSFSETDLIATPNDSADASPPDSSGWTTPEEYPCDPDGPADDGLTLELHKSPKITVQRLADLEDATVNGVEPSLTEQQKSSLESSSTVSSITSGARQRSSASTSTSRKLNRRSWYSIATTPESRSPSPPKKETDPSVEAPKEVAPPLKSRKSFTRRRETPSAAKEKVDKPEKKNATSPSEAEPEPERRKSLSLRRKVTRPVSGIFKGLSVEGSADPPVPDVPPIPKSFSTDRLPPARDGSPIPTRAAPPPRLVSNERHYAPNPLTIPRKKDELWSVFRALDGDYVKFASKTVAFKANVVRSCLVPFLRAYRNHLSNHVLRPEDLDRRANILNRWWTGLIEMLHGRNNQSISGTDRPIILDGISGIMERPEWRLSPSPFCPIHKRTKGAHTPKNRSTTSLSSITSDFLADSVHHNVRNMFVQNLSSQMAFVVDKMSLRNASASLVTFCGKACAYAFMFVPGMADILVRLWDQPTETMRRVLAENGVERCGNLRSVSDSVVSNFPPCLHQLGFVSLAQYNRRLRNPPPLPLGTNNIQWWGYWLERWSGRESDLFYVFVKHFHILVMDFIPPEASPQERMCVPGLLLVHAQMLTNLDATVHRDVGQSLQEASSMAASPTFDDVLVEPDAIASTLPVPPTNATRLMAENRLVMLIRDFLSERAAEHPLARQLFAESFNVLLQAATRGISSFDHAACYTLLDLLEEALVILVRFEQTHCGDVRLINSDFWQLVCRRMICSENTLTEIRLYSFLYTIWNTLNADHGRKADLCLGVLLDPEIFESRFNHWSPMVRAYYMRLLCWRVGRFDGEAPESDVDMFILETLLERLQQTWSHYLWLREAAIEHQAFPPPTNPCNPAPNRRLLIIRTDGNVIAPSDAFLSFEGVVPPRDPTPSRPASRRFSSMSDVAELGTRAASAEPRLTFAPDEPDPSGGLRGFFRGLMGARERPKTSHSTSKRPQVNASLSGSSSPIGPGSLTRAATDDLQTPRERLATPDAAGQTVQPPPPPSTARPHRNFSFKFSLEFNPNIKAPPPLRLVPPRLPLPAQQLLQAYSTAAGALFLNRPLEPEGVSRERASYCGRALAEWALVVGECQSFFDRRRHEGVPGNRLVETPTLGVEVFKRPG